MSILAEKTRNDLKKAIIDAAGRAVAAGTLPEAELPDFVIETPADRSHGDLAANAALVWARAFKKAPAFIAAAVKDNLDLSDTFIDSAEIAGPGFLNFRLGAGYYTEVLKEIVSKGAEYGGLDIGKGQKVMVEFVSANPTGPMHIGNARGGALGDSLAAVLDKIGYDVTREFYINDAGNQIEKFADSLEARYLQIYDPETPFPEKGYLGADITERAGEFAAIHGDEYVGKTSAERRQALVEYALPLNIEGLKNDLGAYGINYDVWFKESLLHNDGELSSVIDEMKEKDLTYESDGALWYKATEHGGEKDEVLVRANGIPTYFAADIAYHVNKFRVRGFDRVINVWGADHHGHVARLKGALDALGIDGDRLHIVLMQLVRLVRDGEVVRVSKRTGKSITLKTLLDEVPLDAARYIFISKEPNTHLEFDLDLAVEQSSQNPVYYVQYAHARICSIMRSAEEQGINIRTAADDELALLVTDEERELISHLAALSDELKLSAEQNDPAKMTRYVYDTATLFHKFYNSSRVIGDDPGLTAARLTLCRCTASVIKTVLGLLKITAPERM